MPKVDIVDVTYNYSQKFRVLAAGVLIMNNLLFIYKLGYFTFFKESMMYLTHWGHNFEILYFLLLLQDTHKNKLTKTKDYEMDMQQSFFSHLQSTLLGAQFLITFFYWIVIFDSNYPRTSFDWYRDIYTHSVPFVLMIIEFFMNRMCIVVKHLKLTFIFVIYYGFINLFFTLITGKPVYSLLDYKDFKSVLFLTGALVTSMLGIALFRIIQPIKMKVVSTYIKIPHQ